MQYSCCRPVVEHDAVSMSGSVVLSGIVIYEASAPNTCIMYILAWVRPSIYVMIRQMRSPCTARSDPYRSTGYPCISLHGSRLTTFPKVDGTFSTRI